MNGAGGAAGNIGGWDTGLPLPTPSQFEAWKHLMMPVLFACGGAVVVLVVLGLVIWMRRPIWLAILGLAGGLVAEIEHVVRNGASVEPRALLVGVFAAIFVSLVTGWVHEQRESVSSLSVIDTPMTAWTLEALAVAERSRPSRDIIEEMGREWQQQHR